jgi:adenine-specific DNA-methyltransferase
MFFMAVSAALLKEHGQMVFITPRSYCSGLYFKRFRSWFLQHVKPVFFHLFESRKKTFKQHVLQETIILKAVKQTVTPSHITISTSENAELQNIHKIHPAYDTVIRSTDHDSMIHLPSDEMALEIVDIIRSWNNTFFNLGFRISTGPVVSFRATQYLTEKNSYDGIHCVPLLWMNHLQDFAVQFPLATLKKPQTMLKTEKSSKLLIKNQYYVFVKRFSSKEQKRRLYASYYSPAFLEHTDYFGLENHVNYIWKPIDGLSQDESLGIMALLNSSLLDSYFRVMNGHTQVNASEIHRLPFPPYDTILQIGKAMKRQDLTPKRFDAIQRNTIVMNILHIPQRVQDAFL